MIFRDCSDQQSARGVRFCDQKGNSVKRPNRREFLCDACVLAAYPALGTVVEEPVTNGALHPTVSLPSDLGRVLTDYENLWAHRDPAALAALFTEDGIVLSPGHQMVRGRGAIARYYTGPGSPLSLRAVAFATEGNVGYIIGGFSRAPGARDVGKFTLTLRRDKSGRWLIQSDMDNGNSPR
jgi:ketosteroid isomerase-like protein